MMWISMTCVVLFAAGYAASIYSWPKIMVWINGVAAEPDRLRDRVAKIEAKLRDI